MTSSKERIKERLHDRMVRAASVAAENRELEQRTKEVASSPEGVLGTTLYSLFNTIDRRNRRVKGLQLIGVRALARIARQGTRVVESEYWNGVRVFKLVGDEVEAHHVKLPAAALELDEEHTFTHEWLLELDGPIQIKETIRLDDSLHCKIFSLTTELGTMETERDLRLSITARNEGGVWIATTQSFDNGAVEDPIVTLGNGSYDQALSLIVQARKATST